MNKRISNLVIPSLLFLAVAGSATAQDAPSSIAANQELANARQMIQEGREAVIREELRLTAEEADGFWPLYEKYRAELMPIQDRYVALVADYMQHYEAGSLTDENAEEMLDAYFDVKSDVLRLRKRYIRQFRKVMPMLKVARFYQLENKMNADIDIELAMLVPLADGD
ncbi:MAG: hypothetical protein GWN47_00790 [Woeseiaceae bacterium]|nr:hypothetical protein [Woeseiaceae bacterium]